MNRKQIRLNESQLNRIVKESVNAVIDELNEDTNKDPFNVEPVPANFGGCKTKDLEELYSLCKKFREAFYDAVRFADKKGMPGSADPTIKQIYLNMNHYINNLWSELDYSKRTLQVHYDVE